MDVKHMLNIFKIRFIELVVVSLLCVFVSGCLPLFVQQRPHPPQHAKAYGHHKKYIYHYYPDSGIYWDVKSKEYVVIKDGIWVKMSSRPTILTSVNSYVIIEVETQNPWLNSSYQKKKTFTNSGIMKVKGRKK